jgi:hypothetical protein
MLPLPQGEGGVRQQALFSDFKIEEVGHTYTMSGRPTKARELIIAGGS